jgi:hypothetical protein
MLPKNGIPNNKETSLAANVVIKISAAQPGDIGGRQ